jgi:hypothetical protein
MFFLVHPEWVSNWELASKNTDNIRTCVSLRTFRQASMRNPFPPLSMEMFLQQVVESQWEPLLDNLFGYSKIKVERENFHKTTLISCDTCLTTACLLAYLMQVPPLKGQYTRILMNWSVSMLILMI